MGQPFGVSSCLPVSPYGGATYWLLASQGYQQLTGQSPDGLMPVALDPVGGRVELFLATSDGDSVVWSYTYGGPNDPAVPHGYAAFPGKNPAWGFSRPLRSDGRTIRAPGCVEDGPPSDQISELLLRCGDGGTDGQYVQLAGSSEGDFYDSRLRFIAQDHAGQELFRFEPLAPALD